MMKPSRFIRSPRRWQLVLVGYWLALFIATHLPSSVPHLPSNPPDKLLHVAAYAGLAALMAIVLQLAIGPLKLRHLCLAWMALLLYGAVDEWTQIPVGRDASIRDWLADAIGAALGLALFFGWNQTHKSAAISSLASEGNGDHSRSWRRFSLRMLFVLVTLVAAICYWSMLPTLNAQRFAAALRDRDFAKAESLFLLPTKAFPGSLKQHQHFEPRVAIEPMTWNDFWKGERRIAVGISYGDSERIATCAAEIRARRAGLDLVILVP